MDYTKARKGSKPDGHHRIVVCPACGKKGGLSLYPPDAKRKGFGDVVHRSHLDTTTGFSFNVVDEHCFISYEQGENL